MEGSDTRFAVQRIKSPGSSLIGASEWLTNSIRWLGMVRIAPHRIGPIRCCCQRIGPSYRLFHPCSLAWSQLVLLLIMSLERYHRRLSCSLCHRLTSGYSCTTSYSRNIITFLVQVSVQFVGIFTKSLIRVWSPLIGFVSHVPSHCTIACPFDAIGRLLIHTLPLEKKLTIISHFFYVFSIKTLFNFKFC